MIGLFIMFGNNLVAEVVLFFVFTICLICGLASIIWHRPKM